MLKNAEDDILYIRKVIARLSGLRSRGTSCLQRSLPYGRWPRRKTGRSRRKNFHRSACNRKCRPSRAYSHAPYCSLPCRSRQYRNRRCRQHIPCRHSQSTRRSCLRERHRSLPCRLPWRQPTGKTRRSARHGQYSRSCARWRWDRRL